MWRPAVGSPGIFNDEGGQGGDLSRGSGQCVMWFWRSYWGWGKLVFPFKLRNCFYEEEHVSFISLWLGVPTSALDIRGWRRSHVTYTLYFPFPFPRFHTFTANWKKHCQNSCLISMLEALVLRKLWDTRHDCLFKWAHVSIMSRCKLKPATPPQLPQTEKCSTWRILGKEPAVLILWPQLRLSIPHW